MMRPVKATKSDSRRHNRELVLRAIYTGRAVNRAALAQETGLTKPTVSDLVSELMYEGFVTEEGYGQAAESGGKRPILLRFVPDARQAIGVSVTLTHIVGVLTDLEGHIAAEHSLDLTERDPQAVCSALVGVINGLVAQADSAILGVGVGLSAVIEGNTILYASGFGWENIPLGAWLRNSVHVPTYLSNNTELAALALWGFKGYRDAARVTAVLIGNTVGVGSVMGDGWHHLGSEIGSLRPNDPSLEERLGWAAVLDTARRLAAKYKTPALAQPDLTYVHIQDAAHRGDPAAVELLDGLRANVLELYLWVIGLLRPQELVLAGSMANLDHDFILGLEYDLRARLRPELLKDIQLSLDASPTLVAQGAAARVMLEELGVL